MPNTSKINENLNEKLTNPTPEQPDTVKPPEPTWDNSAWYRGWEAGQDDMAMRYTDESYVAFKGGADLDAPQLCAKSWNELLELIDDAEDEI